MRTNGRYLARAVGLRKTQCAISHSFHIYKCNVPNCATANDVNTSVRLLCHSEGTGSGHAMIREISIRGKGFIFKIAKPLADAWQSRMSQSVSMTYDWNVMATEDDAAISVSSLRNKLFVRECYGYIFRSSGMPSNYLIWPSPVTCVACIRTSHKPTGGNWQKAVRTKCIQSF